MLSAVSGFNPFDIFGSFLQLIWAIFVEAPLALINVFNSVLTYITSGIISDLLFGSNDSFSFDNIPSGFWIFVIIAVAIFVIVFVIQIIVIQFQEHTENKARFIKAIYSGIRAFIFMFLIPIFFFIANFCISQISKVIVSSFSNNGTIADYLWHLGDASWNGDPGGVPSNFAPPDNIKEYNMIAEIFGVWFMFFAIIIIGLIVVQKTIELFFLFIISPIVMTTMVSDDGKRAFVWKDMVIAKFLASTSVLIGFNLFMMVVHALMTTAISGLNSFARQLFIVLFMCGGALALLGFSNIIAAMVGESIGISESMQSMQSVMGGIAFATGGATMVGKALGVVRTKRNKRKTAQQRGLASGANFAQEFANSNKVMDNAQQGVRIPDNWTRRGIHGLALGIVGGIATGMIAGAKASGITGRNKFTRGVKKVGGAFGKPIVNSSRRAGQFLKQEINPEWKNVANQKHDKQTYKLGELYEKKVKNINNKIANYQFEDKQENKVIKWNNKINKYNKKAENLENFLNKKKNKK